ncbi:hypothetical protein LDENG_00164270, partial [Lucifuga dentata]
MMPQKIPQGSSPDQLECDQPAGRCQVECSADMLVGSRNKIESSQTNGETASSSPESGSINGDGKRSGKTRRRRKRASNSESHPEAKANNKNEEKRDKRLLGLQSECANVWFERSVYEQAESLYQSWLSRSNSGNTKPSRPAPPPENHHDAPSSAAAASVQPACQHGDQVACHHVVQEVWVNKVTFDQAERHFVHESVQLSVPNSLNLPSVPNHPAASRTPDEGYQSLAPTPATPITQQAAATPTTRQPINGLPRIPVELLRDVWLEKPLYDRAEAAFYLNLYGNNTAKRSSCPSASRNSDHPQSLVEEEEEEEEEEEVVVVVVVVEEKRVAPQNKAEVFHTLHPIQEEEEPAEAPEEEEASEGRVWYFLHPDSERVWLDKWRYDAAESRYHGYCGGEATVVRGHQGPDSEASSSCASIASARENTMTAVDFLAQEKIWFDKTRYDEAERRFYERVSGAARSTQDVGSNTILQDIARARENIQKSLAGSVSSSSNDQEFVSRIKSLELENQSLHKVVEDLRSALSKLECRVAILEKSPVAVVPTRPAPPAPTPKAPCANGTAVQQKISTPAKEAEEEEEDDDEDIDLFGSDDEDAEAEQLKQQRLKEYAEKKAKKPGVIAKSSILLDVKPVSLSQKRIPNLKD